MIVSAAPLPANVAEVPVRPEPEGAIVAPTSVPPLYASDTA